MNKIAIGLVSILLATLIGCGQNNAQQEGRNNNQNPNVDEVKQSVDQPGHNNQRKLSANKIANNLTDVAGSVPQVNNATAIVTMGYAVVGIDVDKNLDRNGVDDVKYSVARSLKHQRYGANAVVIADPDTVQRLKNMKNNIQDGRPVSGVMDQLADIIGRFAPQTPMDTKKQNHNEKPKQHQAGHGQKSQPNK